MKTAQIRILIADDHGVVRSGLRSLLESDPKFNVVGEASSGEEAISLIEKHKPDVAIIDISMPSMSGVELTRLVKQRSPLTKVLILTIHENEEYVQQMISEGAKGYVLKNAEKEELFAAVRAVAADKTFFSPAIFNLMVGDFIRRAKGEKQDKAKVLTKREAEILRLIVQGLTSRQIADRLFLSISTVNTHRANLMQKLQIHDTAGLVRYAIQSGIVPPES